MSVDLVPIESGTTFEDVFDGLAQEGLTILYDRQRKYGPKNIQQQGLWGVFTRIKDDKISRVERAFNGKIEKGKIVLDDIVDATDESFEDALFDIANYALIMIALKRGVWGKPLREETGEVQALIERHGGIENLPRLTLTPQEEEAERAREALAGSEDDLDYAVQSALDGEAALREAEAHRPKWLADLDIFQRGVTDT